MHDLDTYQIVGGTEPVPDRKWWLQHWDWRSEHGVLWLELLVRVPEEVTPDDPLQPLVQISCSFLELDDDETKIIYESVDTEVMAMTFSDLLRTLPSVWYRADRTYKGYREAGANMQDKDKKAWKDVSFELPIELGHFRTWFQEATISLITEAAPTFETPDGAIFLTAYTDCLGEGYHCIDAQFEDVAGVIPIPSQPTWGSGVIQFNARSFAPARLGTYAVCYRPELISYFDELLSLLKYRYPEVRLKQIEYATNIVTKEVEGGGPVAKLRPYFNVQVVANIVTSAEILCHLIEEATLPLRFMHAGRCAEEPEYLLSLPQFYPSSDGYKHKVLFCFQDGYEAIHIGITALAPATSQTPEVKLLAVCSSERAYKAYLDLLTRIHKALVSRWTWVEAQTTSRGSFTILPEQATWKIEEILDEHPALQAARQTKRQPGAKGLKANQWLQQQWQISPNIPLAQLEDEYVKRRKEEGKPVFIDQDVIAIMRAALHYRVQRKMNTPIEDNEHRHRK